MKVKPAEGRAVRFPGTLRLLDKDGAYVPETAFWLRALSRGDVQRIHASIPSTIPARSAASAETATEKAPA
ncbi:DUF2635 domain-containing protein [Acetobacter tropicalis]|uniref:DUF2635 domain-containing protein n=1 Tax=Acetobacter tropicalis TaxID=104102 RepID=A0A095AWM9_9PROT|nr:DUF2635 domain-containing protein [Acetobacter tropicalis]KAA8387042.1 DUF2635 domain-containing protein [Acetobacter tropicalis]KAA8391387.1 DUF2635 domain-containing protein [Acetobacter tropicalis]KGB21168.1 hypothetical protein AtDm6_3163 [Acetobacter tropicalis]MBC9008791.1 DUF2635 domain-containing protein [Acetobacter tropicalis]MDO8171964.1 DUF2635 domain-containing protein [Acetobacter tropicalis]